jgi:hypothetical protein
MPKKQTTSTFTTEAVKTSDLALMVAEYNPRYMEDEQAQFLAHGVETFGMLLPIVAKFVSTLLDSI